MSDTSLPKTQKKWSWEGVPNGFDGLQFRDTAVLQPGIGEVLVRIHAMSLNYRDVVISKNQYYGGVPIENCVPGCDAVGEVVALGDRAGQWTIGDRVAAVFFLGDTGAGLTDDIIHTAIPGPKDSTGSLLQYRTFPATSLVKVPETLSWEEASTLPCAGVTAYNALFGGPHPLKAGETVLLQGTGGVSTIAAQIARASGARVIITSSSDEKLAIVAKLVGAHETINYKTHPDWATKVLELTEGVGAHHILEVVGGENVNQSMKALARGGTISVIGFINGVFSNLSLEMLMFKAANVRGIGVGQRQHHIDLHRLVELHKIKPVVGKTFKFGQAVEALKTLDKQDFIGKVVVQNSQK